MVWHRLAVRAAVPAVFFVSGAAGLVYEILWTRQFVTLFGNSAYAISIVLCAFMAGLGAGGIWFGRRADRIADPLRLYALLELGIAAAALLLPLALDLLRLVTPSLLAALPAGLVSVSAVRLACTFLVLFVPCVLMGGTLPVLARFCVDAPGVVGQRIGILYGLNTLGGACGCLFAGYHLIETYGVAATGRMAAAANVTIAAAALLVRRLAPGARLAPAPSEQLVEPGDGSGSDGRALVLLAALLSGFTTLSCEVMWARFIAFVCYSNPYTFTAILGIFLVGLAAGSLAFRFLLARRAAAGDAASRLGILGLVQIAAGAAAVAALLFGSWLIAGSGPKAAVRLAGAGDFNQRIWWPALNVLLFAFVPTVVMGMVFPLACAAFTRSLGKVGRSVGLVYGLNTAGCIAGSLAPVFLLIPWMGIQKGLIAVALLNAGVGAAFLFACSRRRSGWQAARCRVAAAAGLGLLLLVAGAAPADLAQAVFLQGVFSVGPQYDIVYYDEGRTGTSMVLRDKIDGLFDLYINSVNEVPTSFLAQGIFRLMGHLGPLLHPDPAEALAVCFGGGIAGGALSLHPAVRTLDVVDLESSVIDAARVLRRENNRLHDSRKLKVHIEDGRNFLLTCVRTYPLIICDSTHPKSADSWVLYTREFYETVAGRLADPGVFIQWLPFHGISADEYRIIAATFQSVFPHASLWVLAGCDEKGAVTGYSLLVAMLPELRIDLAVMAERLAAPAVKADLAPYAMDTVPDMLRHFVCGEETLRRWTAGLPVNTDDLPLTQYRSVYSAPPMAHFAMFAPLLESPRPYLANAGDGPEPAELEERLELGLRIEKLMLAGYWAEARALAPADRKLDLAGRLAEQGQRWRAVKEAQYSNR